VEQTCPDPPGDDRVAFGLELVGIGSGLERLVSRIGRDSSTTTTPSTSSVTSATGSRAASAARARCLHVGRRAWAGPDPPTTLQAGAP